MKVKTLEIKRDKDAEKKSNIDQFLKGSKGSITKTHKDSVSNQS